MIDQPLIRRDRILLAVPLLLLAALLSRALVAGGRPAGWDHALDALRFIPANPDAPEVAAAVSLLGTGWVLYPILLLLAGVRIRRGERLSVALAPLAVLVAGQVVRMLLLSGVAGSRPDLPGARIEGPAFSSGHAMAAVLGWGLIAGQILLLRRDPPEAVRRLATGSVVVIALAVGLSRVYLGVHWVRMSSAVGRSARSFWPVRRGCGPAFVARDVGLRSWPASPAGPARPGPPGPFRCLPPPSQSYRCCGPAPTG